MWNWKSKDSSRSVEFIAQEIGDKHAYQWAIHTPTAIDGGTQPHLHLMFSERQVDGIERDPEQYFRRYNTRSPEKGGARKAHLLRPRNRFFSSLLAFSKASRADTDRFSQSSVAVAPDQCRLI